MFELMLGMASRAPNYALVLGGYTTTGVATTAKYDYSTGAWSNGTTLQDPLYSGAGFGNKTSAYVAGGVLSGAIVTKITKYVFATNMVSTLSAVLTLGRQGAAGVGNISYGHVGGGYSGSVFLTNVNRMAYSNETVANGVSLNLNGGGYQQFTVGNDTDGYFMGGYNSATGTYFNNVDRHTYSSNTSTAMTALLSTRSAGAAHGTTTMGYLSGGYAGTSTSVSATTTTTVRTYASGANSTGTSLSGSHPQGTGASNKTLGVIVSGSVDNSVETYTYASSVVANTASLSAKLYRTAAASSVPGGLA